MHHAYVHVGDTAKFYDGWKRAEGTTGRRLDLWHSDVGNLGPVANAEGDVEIGIRDLEWSSAIRHMI